MAKRRKLSDDPIVRVIQRHGWATLRRALTFTAAWAVVAEAIGHEPTLDEYRDWWAASERTTFREQAAFRAVTGLDDPAPIYRQAKAEGVVFDDSARKGGGVALLPFMTWAES